MKKKNKETGENPSKTPKRVKFFSTRTVLFWFSIAVLSGLFYYLIIITLF